MVTVEVIAMETRVEQWSGVPTSGRYLGCYSLSRVPSTVEL